jgi:acetyl esterase
LPVDPTFQTLLDSLGGPDAPDLADMSVTDARQLIGLMSSIDGEPEPVGSVENRAIPGPAGDIPVRIYQPAPAETITRAVAGTTGLILPGILVWFHGGGWVIGDLESADGTARQLANRSGAIVVSVDYRLAPEHPFPAGPDDSWAALAWVADHGAELGGDPTRLAVGGDSAGGNLAAVVAVRARDAGAPALAHQLLVYPATDLTLSHDSIDENGRGYLLTKRAMTWFTDLYLGADGNAKDPMASPLFTDDLSGLPPATVLTAGYDPLRDEGEAYAEALRAAGVPVDLTRYDTMIHGFFSLGALTPVAAGALVEAAGILQTALAG